MEPTRAYLNGLLLIPVTERGEVEESFSQIAHQLLGSLVLATKQWHGGTDSQLASHTTLPAAAATVLTASPETHHSKCPGSVSHEGYIQTLQTIRPHGKSMVMTYDMHTLKYPNNKADQSIISLTRTIQLDLIIGICQYGSFNVKVLNFICYMDFVFPDSQ